MVRKMEMLKIEKASRVSGKEHVWTKSAHLCPWKFLSRPSKIEMWLLFISQHHHPSLTRAPFNKGQFLFLPPKFSFIKIRTRLVDRIGEERVVDGRRKLGPALRKVTLHPKSAPVLSIIERSFQPRGKNRR